MKTLKDILEGCKVLKTIGDENIAISGITFDSRAVGQGFLFVAMTGTSADGHQFIEASVDKGAVAVICEKLPQEIRNNVVYIVTDNSAKALGIISSNFFDKPSHKLKLVGITGTNGKTTTATLLYRMARGLGFKAGLLSTVRNYIDDEPVEATHTTPDSVQLNLLLKKMADRGCKYAFMEVSSHAIVQDRIAGLNFTGAIFSNITHDHLDYHKTFEEYLRAKKKFFDNLPKDAFALINADDKNGKVMVQNTAAAVKYYGLKSMADFKAKIIESHFDGTLLNIDKTELWTKFLGEFNAYNLLAVYSTSILLGFQKDEVLKVLSKFDTVEGRFEYLHSNDGVIAIVDYAHTPDALVNVLNTINQIRTRNEQLIVVVGAGGNRDKTKRPKMAKACVQNSDKVILTSDNPRFEEPMDIIKDMEAGIEEQYRRNYLVIADRKEAIKTACMMAKKGDIILVAGKGHEPYQEIKGVKYHFNDKEIIVEQFMLNKTNPQ
ncbi:MAG: UDP-N-acetylmuramoyl-L-alanyl-D-glutamate--2,6-diaminopimelate ligase [Bacteroidales bacterium]|nr:UDP-N-acetylmuramoyl-L-alanyl-D-glutamate--2,6-diaminopimelate ligase [Bacteroidales bacterium]